MKPRVVATGIGFGEGPVWRPDTQDLIVTSVSEGALLHVDVETGKVEKFADTAGGPNGALLCDDGGLLVTQNGGLDVSPFASYPVPPVRPMKPGIQRVAPDGKVSYVDGPDLLAPNDLAVDRDGSVVFSDIVFGEHYAMLGGRLWRLGEDLSMTLVEEVDHYLNGVAAAPTGLATAEGDGIRWLRGADRGWLNESAGRTDGFAFDAEGRAYICGLGEGVLVVEPDGTVSGKLPELSATNCCFGGPELRTLYAAGQNEVVAWDDMPTPGHPLTPFKFRA